MSDKYIYAFVHIPKTAGYTLRYHLLKNFKEEQMLHMSFNNLNLNGYNPPTSEKVFRNAAHNYVKSLNRDRRKKVDIIFGHLVHSGLQKYFDREIRYITFIRKPDEWLFSLYRHWVRRSEVKSDRKDRKDQLNKVLMRDGKILDYLEWLEKRRKTPSLENYSNMAGFLNRRGFSSSFENESEALKLLKKFYFVGLTKNFCEESLFIYDLIGVNKFFFDQNIATNKINITQKDKRKGSEYVNDEDWNIYNAAVQINTHFKSDNPEYCRSVEKKKLEKKILLPFTQPIFAPRKTAIRIYEKFKYDKPLFK